jgi:hypothetical protein
MQTGVSYYSSRDIRHIRADIAEMRDAGCTYVVHCYSETDLAYHRPLMRQVADATHDAGMEVWFDPWGQAGIFSGETFTRFPLDHPETWQMLNDGRRVGCACPNHPATREFVRGWVDACAEAGGDVVMWDEPHFWSALWARDLRPAWACYCDNCRSLFRERFGHEPPSEFTAEIKAFRESVLLDFLTELCRYAKSKGLRNALCLFPTDLPTHGFHEPGDMLRAFVKSRADTELNDQQLEGMLHIGIGDFETAAAIPDLDIFSTDPYWFLLGVDPEKFMRTYSELAARAAKEHNRELQLWLQAFRLPAGREEELRMGVRIAEEVGATHLAAWTFRATETMSIACADPAKVWSIITEEFRRLSGR